MSQPAHPRRMTCPGQRRRWSRILTWWWRAVRRLQGIEAESVLEVRQQQFLVLLLVVQSQFDNVHRGGLIGTGQPVQNAFIDGPAIVVNLLHCWTRHDTASGTRQPVA